MRWVVGDSRGRVALIEDGALLWRADAHPKNAVLAVQFDGKMLHSFGRDGKMATFEVDESPHLASIQPLHVSVSGVCDDVAWGVVGAELVVLDVATNMRRATVMGTNRGRPHGVRVSGKSVRAVAAASDDEGGFLVVASETICVTCGAPLVADGVAAAVTLASGRVVLAGGGGDLAEYAADLREQTRRCSRSRRRRRGACCAT